LPPSIILCNHLKYLTIPLLNLTKSQVIKRKNNIPKHANPIPASIEIIEIVPEKMNIVPKINPTIPTMKAIIPTIIAIIDSKINTNKIVSVMTATATPIVKLKNMLTIAINILDRVFLLLKKFIL